MDFISSSFEASSYMIRVNFENLPFGNTDEIVEFTIVVAEMSEGTNIKANNVVNGPYLFTDVFFVVR